MIILPNAIFCKKIIYSLHLTYWKDSLGLQILYMLQYKYIYNLDNLVIIRSDLLFTSLRYSIGVHKRHITLFTKASYAHPK